MPWHPKTLTWIGYMQQDTHSHNIRQPSTTSQMGRPTTTTYNPQRRACRKQYSFLLVATRFSRECRITSAQLRARPSYTLSDSLKSAIARNSGHNGNTYICNNMCRAASACRVTSSMAVWVKWMEFYGTFSIRVHLFPLIWLCICRCCSSGYTKHKTYYYQFSFT